MDEIKKPEHLKKYIKETKYRVLVPLVILNYPFRWLAYGLDKVALLKALEYLSYLGVIVAVSFYVSESGERLKARHYQAWQVINLAQGKPGEGGRTTALQDLCNDRVSLSNIDLSNAKIPRVFLKNADLRDANLSRADLNEANLSGAILVNANLSGAILTKANFSGAYLMDANLSGAILTRANLSGTTLWAANLSEVHLEDANLSGASLWKANLSGASLWKANLSEANLWEANLPGAKLWEANLQGAFLRGANLSGANLNESDINSIKNWQEIKDINKANIWGVKNAPEGFIEWAKEHGALSIENPFEWEKMFKRNKPEKNEGKLKVILWRVFSGKSTQ
jgi:uncharacterized protein YjbI with pentapeptide repeats